MPKKHMADLTPDDRQEMEQSISSGTGSARKLTPARVLLEADEGWTNKAISEALDVGATTVERMRKRLLRVSSLEAMERWKLRRRCERKLDGDAMAGLIALACSTPLDLL